MSDPTPSIPGVDREALAAAIYDAWKDENRTTSIPRYVSADAAIAYIAAHQKRPALPSDTAPTVLRLAAADIRGMHLGFGGLPRSLPGTLEALADALEAAEATPSPTSSELEHDDEWVEVDDLSVLPKDVRVRSEWTVGTIGGGRRFVHRDDLPDTTKPKGDPMSTSNENMTVVTDRDRTPDPVATIKPFRHPWITGDDSCGECGQFFREHWSADAGDHGHTVCRLPEPDDAWVEVDKGTLAGLPNGKRVRREWVMGAYDRYRYFIHRDDLPDPDADRVERMAKAIHKADSPNSTWDKQVEFSKKTYRVFARAALAASREEER